MGSKSIYLFLIFPLVSCQTLYYPAQEFTKQSYTPVKKGTIELMVKPKVVSTFSTPSHLFDHNTAYRRGEKRVKRAMQKFCGGKYKILSAVKKKEKIRMETHTSSSSHYGSDTYRSDRSQNANVLEVHPSKPMVGIDYRGSRRKVYVQKTPQALVQRGARSSVGRESQTGSAYGGSSTVTQPVYRRYTEFQFQCK